MKARTIVLALAVMFAALAVCFADDANVGTWKLNESKSKIPAGVNKNTSVVYTAEGDQYKAVVDGVDASGKATHNEWTGKFDGKDYPVTGDPNVDTRAIKKGSSANHYDITNKKAGKATATGTIVVSPDGKTRTVTTHTRDSKGKEVTATYVYEKQ